MFHCSSALLVVEACIAVVTCFSYPTPGCPSYKVHRSIFHKVPVEPLFSITTNQRYPLTIQQPPSRKPTQLFGSSNNVKIGEISVTRDHPITGNNTQYRLAYRIARPLNLSSRQAYPVVVLHGGPSLPSDYLYPLDDVLPYRSIVYHDQLGCGESDAPDNPQLGHGGGGSVYSIHNSVLDLEALLKKLGIRKFHLYGHSYGGILAFEYMKRQLEQRLNGQNNDGISCLSAVLSSAPSDIPKTEQDWERLLHALSAGDADASKLDELNALFFQTHQCRTSEMPAPLQTAFSKLGSVWGGLEAISDYVAKPVNNLIYSDSKARMPSTLVIRGEHDFVLQDNVHAWKKALNHDYVRFRTIDECSHFILLEKGEEYGELLDSFFGEYD